MEAQAFRMEGWGTSEGTGEVDALQPIMKSPDPSQPQVLGFLEYYLALLPGNHHFLVLRLFLDSSAAQRSGRHCKLLASEAGMDGICLIAGQPQDSGDLARPTEGEALPPGGDWGKREQSGRLELPRTCTGNFSSEKPEVLPLDTYLARDKRRLRLGCVHAWTLRSANCLLVPASQ